MKVWNVIATTWVEDSIHFTSYVEHRETMDTVDDEEYARRLAQMYVDMWESAEEGAPTKRFENGTDYGAYVEDSVGAHGIRVSVIPSFKKEP